MIILDQPTTFVPRIARPVPRYQSKHCTLFLGDAFDVLPYLRGIDAVVTDPPYSSGGNFRSDRNLAPSQKYVQTGDQTTCRIEFSGDNRDQRAFLAWSAAWMRDALYCGKRGSVLLSFSDWRQVPIMSDALQMGGWTWRNLVTWWKRGVRMQRGRFSASAEFVLYGSLGVPTPGERSPQNVVECQPVPGEEKEHIAEKPVALLQELVGVTTRGAIVLDPFMGSGAVGEACLTSGRFFVGIECDEDAFHKAAARLQRIEAQGMLAL